MSFPTHLVSEIRPLDLYCRHRIDGFLMLQLSLRVIHCAVGIVVSILCALPHIIFRTNLRDMCFECAPSVD